MGHITWRPTTDPKPKPRICATCHQRTIGLQDRAHFTIWVSDTPLSPALEAIHLAANIPTYWIRPQPGGTAWLDWRPRETTARDLIHILLGQHPDPGHLVLPLHPHRTPGPTCPAPTWLTPPRPTAVEPTDEGIPF